MKKLFMLMSCLYMASNLFAYEKELTLIDSPVPNNKIEILLEKPANSDYKLLIFLHGAPGKGLKSISELWFSYWLKKGYAVASVSMPGFGESTGKKDFSGPFTLSSINYAIDVIKNKLNVSDFGMVGFGQGGIVAILLSAQRNDIRCLVCANGAYDLFRHKVQGDTLMNLIKENDYDFDTDNYESLKYRSAIQHVSSISTPIYILHRKENPIITEKEASDFYNAMLGAGKTCYISFKDKTPDADIQKLSYDEVLASTEEWIDILMLVNPLAPIFFQKLTSR